MIFTLTITQDNRSEPIRLTFLSEDKADHAYDTLAATMREDIKAVEVSDDEGRRVALWGFSSLLLERSSVDVSEAVPEPSMGLFDQMKEHEKADTIPWRSSRGLE